MEWILASGSPRRKELLAQIIFSFSVIPSKADESVEERVSPKNLVGILAKRKAAEVALRPEHEGKMVIGADTIVVLGGKVLGKPKDEEDAFRMLKSLSGKRHAVYTGVCVSWAKNGKFYCDCKVDKTVVVFNRLSNEWIKEYVASGSPMDKAGAYGIQDGGLVKKIKGSYSNVVGFPVELFKKMIKNLEVGSR